MNPHTLLDRLLGLKIRLISTSIALALGAVGSALLSGCALFEQEPSYIKGEITNYQERLQLVSGISFLPPNPVPDYSPKAWEMIQWFAVGTTTEFDMYRFSGYVPHGPQGHCCYVRVSIVEKSGEIAAEIATTDMDTQLIENHKRLEAGRLKRKELFRGTLEERWQEALEADPDLVAKYVKDRYLLEKGAEESVAMSTFSKAKQIEKVRSSFKSHLRYRRRLHKYLPHNTSEIIHSNGKRCLANGSYEGLPIPAAPYDTPTSGGAELNYSVYCPTGPETMLVVHLYTQIPPNEHFAAYPILKPIMDSIDWAGH